MTFRKGPFRTYLEQKKLKRQLEQAYERYGFKLRFVYDDRHRIQQIFTHPTATNPEFVCVGSSLEEAALTLAGIAPILDEWQARYDAGVDLLNDLADSDRRASS